jgi:hypothetical protein
MAHEEFRPKDFWGQLAHTVEEAGEVMAAAGKTFRFGVDSFNPLLPIEQQETNWEWLERELDDLILAAAKLKESMAAGPLGYGVA